MVLRDIERSQAVWKSEEEPEHTEETTFGHGMSNSGAAAHAEQVRRARAKGSFSEDLKAEATSMDAVGVFEAACTGDTTEIPYRAEMESAFGQSFDHVRAVNGAGALRSVGAAAATDGDKVLFGESPDRRLVAHELAHVVQRGNGRTGQGMSSPDQAGEQEASMVANAVARGEMAPKISGAMPAEINRSVLSWAIGKGVKKITKDKLKDFINKRILKRLSEVKNKDFKKQVRKEVDEIYELLTDSWWETVLGFIPIIGDAYQLVDVAKDARKALKAADRLEEKLRKHLKKAGQGKKNNSRHGNQARGPGDRGRMSDSPLQKQDQYQSIGNAQSKLKGSRRDGGIQSTKKSKQDFETSLKDSNPRDLIKRYDGD